MKEIILDESKSPFDRKLLQKASARFEKWFKNMDEIYPYVDVVEEAKAVIENRVPEIDDFGCDERGEDLTEETWKEHYLDKE